MENFTERLRAACNETKSLVCVGLDVAPDLIPEAVLNIGTDRGSVRAGARACYRFNRAIVDATADLVCAYKPNLAFYEAQGLPGVMTLMRTVKYIRQTAPHSIIIGDSKMGDIGSTAKSYAAAMFDVLDFDAVTINAWGGRDTAEPWLSYPDRGTFIWCRGSNIGSGDFQDLNVINPQDESLEPMYLRMARKSRTWSTEGNIGLIVGATAPEQLNKVRTVCPDVPLLIPGIGVQGGDLESTVKAGVTADGIAIINSSRGIIYASPGADYAEAARDAAAMLRNEINRFLCDMELGWPLT